MMGLGDDMKSRMMSTIADPAQNEQIRSLAGVFATIEMEQRERLQEHAEAVGADPEAVGLGEDIDKEERIDAICAALAARMSGDPWQLWLDHVAPAGFENGERAKRYAGDVGKYEASKAAWVEEYRANDAVPTDGVSDDEIAEQHVSDVFGVDLDTFEEEVVGWSAAETFETVVVGGLVDNTDAIPQLTEEVDR